MKVASLLALLCCGCATLSSIPPLPAGAIPKRPVLLVHGIDDSGKTMVTLANALIAGGWTELRMIDLDPNDGAAGIPALAEQIDRHARELATKSPSGEIDLVAFSMGSLISRYWLRRMEPSVTVKTFVSISGPHHGTWTGYLRWNEGATQMRPGSPLIQDLSRDEGEWGGVEVYSFWTPLDLMIFPARSSRLKNAVERRFPVAVHPWMLRDRRVLQSVQAALTGELRPERPFEGLPSWP